MAIIDDLLEEHREESTVPVEEAASSRFAYHDLPAWNHLKFLIPVKDVFKFLLSEDFWAD